MDALARLLIERACERLIVDYARFVDFGEASRIAELFTEDGVWESEGLRMEGRSAIREGFARREGVRRRVSRHACTNVAVDVISADEARGLCYLINYRFDRREGDDPAAPAPAGRAQVRRRVPRPFRPRGRGMAVRAPDLHARLRPSAEPVTAQAG